MPVQFASSIEFQQVQQQYNQHKLGPQQNLPIQGSQAINLPQQTDTQLPGMPPKVVRNNGQMINPLTGEIVQQQQRQQQRIFPQQPGQQQQQQQQMHQFQQAYHMPQSSQQHPGQGSQHSAMLRGPQVRQGNKSTFFSFQIE